MELMHLQVRVQKHLMACRYGSKSKVPKGTGGLYSMCAHLRRCRRGGRCCCNRFIRCSAPRLGQLPTHPTPPPVDSPLAWGL
jgi:hypothetical protein